MAILHYPLTTDGNGNLLLASDVERIKCLVWSFIETEPGEMPMLPDYGTPNSLFSTQSDFDAFLVRLQLRLAAEIPEGEFAVVGRIFDDGNSGADIYYSLQNTQTEVLTVAFT